MKASTRIALAALAFSATAAQAHDIWLLPSTTVLSRAGYVTVDGAVSNDTFHFTYRPLMLRDNLVISAPDGSLIEAENVMQGNLRTVFDARLPADGSYRFALVNGGVFASWKDGDETRRWRGAREELEANVPAEADELRLRETFGRIETFVTVGSPSDITAEGQGLEMLPVTHPNDLYAEEEATFRFVVDGEPLVGAEISILAGGTRYRDQLEKASLTTDAEGRISYTWPAPGMYWLSAVVHDENTALKNAERRLSYAATLEVLPQ